QVDDRVPPRVREEREQVVLPTWDELRQLLPAELPPVLAGVGGLEVNALLRREGGGEAGAVGVVERTGVVPRAGEVRQPDVGEGGGGRLPAEIGRASCRERVW